MIKKITLLTLLVVSGITTYANNQDQHRGIKDWTFIVYIAGRNDLQPFIRINLNQMKAVGSSSSINVVAQAEDKQGTHRYLVEKNELVAVDNQYPQAGTKSNTGDPETLISCCEWAIKNYPARNYALIGWDHGTGYLDPYIARKIRMADIISSIADDNLIELRRTLTPPSLIDREKWDDTKGACFDDSFRSYLTNGNIRYALDTVCSKFLNGGKFTLVGFDACLMSTIEVADLLAPFSEYLVSSQEVELGTGWNYAYVLEPFASGTLSAQQFARHITHAYERAYRSITKEYTLSAITLPAAQQVERNVNQVGKLLIQALNSQKGESVKNAIKLSRASRNCTHFDEPTYIDLGHFYANLLQNIDRFDYKNPQGDLTAQLRNALNNGCDLIDRAVIANRTGSKHAKATGITIYFPERRIHSSYKRSDFAYHNAWGNFIEAYIKA